MKRQPFASFTLAGISLTDFGLKIPSPFVTLELGNSEIQSCTSWTLKCTVTGSDREKANIAAFEALLYSAAQEASGYSDSSGIPVAFMFGWLNNEGVAEEYVSYQGFTLQYSVSTSGLYLTYTVTGYATLAVQSSMPVLRVPALCGFVQPSAVVEGLAKGVKATNYYDLDIDHNDAPTLINHGSLSTSFNSYVRGTYTGEDNFDDFPGLLRLAKSYNANRLASGLKSGYKTLSQIINNHINTPIVDFLKSSLTDTTPQCASFVYWVDEPTMTHPGTIHFKSASNLLASQNIDTLQYGTANTNIISLSGSYNGVAYNMTDLNFKNLGFALDGSGNQIADSGRVITSWSSTLTDVFQTANIINDINALASQFSGDFTLTIPGSVKRYSIGQPISLLVMSGNTVSPISGIYNIISVGHAVSNTFITTLKIQRFMMSSANQVAASQNITVRGSANYDPSSYSTTSNIKSTHKVDFGTLYPDFTHIASSISA